MSRIRTNLITNRMANGAPTVSNGLVISGVTTSTTFSGSGASLTNIPSAQLTGALPALDGSNLTGITQTAINNNANNRVITGSGTANTLEGEATLTFTNSGSAGSLNLKRTTSSNQEAIFYYGSGGLEIETRESTPIILKTNTSPRLQITSGGDVCINSTGLSSPYTTFRNLSINNNLILNAQNSAGGFTGMQNNAYLNSSGNWVRVHNDHATSIGTDDGNFYFRNAGAGTGNITWSQRLNILANGNLGINETSPDTKLHISHSNATEDVIKLEATPVSAGTGERSRMIFQITQSNGQSAKLGHIASHSLNGWGGELSFHTKPANSTPNNTTNETMRLHANGYVTQSSQPSFAAYRNQDGYGLNNEVFPFNVTRHNTGSHFNTGNHRFTAPVAGRYMFTFYSILNSQVNSGIYSFRVNNSTSYGHNVHFTTVNSSWDHVSTSQIMNLSANDYVTLWSNSNINWHGNGWQIFCGELLS